MSFLQGGMWVPRRPPSPRKTQFLDGWRQTKQRSMMFPLLYCIKHFTEFRWASLGEQFLFRASVWRSQNSEVCPEEKAFAKFWMRHPCPTECTVSWILNCAPRVQSTPSFELRILRPEVKACRLLNHQPYPPEFKARWTLNSAPPPVNVRYFPFLLRRDLRGSTAGVHPRF